MSVNHIIIDLDNSGLLFIRHQALCTVDPLVAHNRPWQFGGLSPVGWRCMLSGGTLFKQVMTDCQWHNKDKFTVTFESHYWNFLLNEIHLNKSFEIFREICLGLKDFISRKFNAYNYQNALHTKLLCDVIICCLMATYIGNSRRQRTYPECLILSWVSFDTLRPRQNGRLSADDIFKRIFFNEIFIISIKISLRLVLGCPIDNKSALVLVIAWCRLVDKPLSKLMMT